MTSPKIMAILNITPDSFSDGGNFATHEKAISQAQRLQDEGADIIDIGAESTRPGYTPLSSAEELQRLMPILDEISRTLALPISVDTYKSRTAEAALKRGAVIINDIWGLSFDPGMASVVADFDAGLVIMHNRHEKDEAIDIIEDMIQFFERALDTANKAGIAPDYIALDPGIGFGKTQNQNLKALQSVATLKRHFDLPVLVGASRKSFINAIHPSCVTARLGGTLAAHLHAVQQGADIIRVHDVADHVQALAVSQALVVS